MPNEWMDKIRKYKIQMAKLDLNQSKLADEYGCHKSHITNVFKRRRTNKNIINWLDKRLGII